MADQIKSGLRRALDDMNAGIELLLGLREPRRDLVRELLTEGEAAAPHSRLAPRRRSHPRRVRPRRRRSASHLSLVE